MTLKELIEELHLFAETYGEDVEVQTYDSLDDEWQTPTLSGGPSRRDGKVRVNIL